jgi:hypothetical protein
MESASRAERNIGLSGASSGSEGSPYMQTARKPNASGSESARQSDATPKARRTPAPGIIVSAVVLGFYVWIVNMLEGIDFDTLFLAFFCAGLTMFVFKAMATAFAGERP